MLEIKITLDAAPSLSDLLQSLTCALGQTAAPVHPTPAADSQPAADLTPAPAPAAVTAPTTAPDPVPISAPTVPTATAPAFTAEQVGRAGSEFISVHPERMNDLLSLLSGYGVQAITELKPEQLGAFATALRGMGARI